MTDPDLLARVEAFARPYCEGNPEFPGLWANHVRLVRYFAVRLAEVEGVDQLVLEVAAVLHDVGKDRGRAGHHHRSYELSKAFLETTDLPTATQELILECVLKHRTRSAGAHNPLEVRVMQAADMLGTLFDDEWQEYSRRSMSWDELLHQYERVQRKLTLESARAIAAPRIADLEARLAEGRTAPSAPPTVDDLLAAYDWYDHPEGPKFVETHRDTHRTSGHWLFLPGVFSAFHKVLNNDELWLIQQGRLLLHVLGPDGGHQILPLGFDVAQGEHPVAAVPAGWWQAAELPEGAPFAFGVNVCAPPFSFDEFVPERRDELLRDFPQHADIVMRLTRGDDR